MTQAIPVVILPEGAQRTKGRDAQRMNILAARTVAEVVKSTLGPKGMDKMLVDTLGDVVVTNDGVTILGEMEIEHPTAKMMVEIAKVQGQEIGDGTTTAVMVAGELLKNAESLLDLYVHPTIIVQGYRLAAAKAQEVLDTISETVTPNDRETLLNIARTAMTGKNAEGGKDLLAELSVSAVLRVLDRENGRPVVDKDNIRIGKKRGGSLEDSELIEGIVLESERVHSGMPRSVKDARIALVDSALEIKKTETSAEISISDPNLLDAFLEQEERILREMVGKVKASGANVLLCQKGIDDLAQHYLAKEGIFAIRRVKKSDMDKLARATGGRLVTNLDDLSTEDIGQADLVEGMKVAGDDMTFVRGCTAAKAVTILVRGGTEHVVNELGRAVDDAIDDIVASIKGGKVVAGGGAIEIEIARELRKYADTVGGKEQLAINAFADAIEVCPRTLAESAGLDPIDKLMSLRASHENGGKWYGLDVDRGEVVDMYTSGVIEPMLLKSQAIKSAAEVAEMVLRIDDIVVAKELTGGKGGGGDMEGMGDY